ncbi:MAG: SPOR domain-containing protein, partial [Gammaproteobacteria bacterium]
RVNDRGPFLQPGIIELSAVAAAKLGIKRGQVAQVDVEGISGGADAPASAPRETLQAAPVATPLKRWTPPANSSASTATPALNSPDSAPRTTRPTTPIRSLATTRESAEQKQASDALEGATTAVTQTQRQPAPTSRSGFDVQAGAFQSRENADRLLSRLRRAGLTPSRVLVEPSGATNLYKVRVGPYANRRDAEQAATAIRSLGINSPRIIAP